MPYAPTGTSPLPRGPLAPERWLLVGWPGAAPAAPEDCEVVRASEVHAALELLQHDRFARVLVAPDALVGRPRAALRALGRAAPESALAVVGPEPHAAVARACRALGVEQSENPPARGTRRLPEPRGEADDRIDLASFAAGCLERLAQPESLREHVLAAFAAASGARRASLVLPDLDGSRLLLALVRGRHAAQPGEALAEGRGLAARAHRTGVAETGRVAESRERGAEAGGYAGSAYVVVPLGDPTAPAGVVCLTELPGDELPDGETLRDWHAAARAAGHALAAARRESDERRQADLDALTGLPTRRALVRAYEREHGRAQRAKRHVALALLDVDRFKSVNTEFGWPGGDQLLREIAALLAQSLRPGDLAVRWGGEEFVVLLTELEQDAQGTAEEKAATALERIRKRVEDCEVRVAHKGRSVSRTLSGGWVLGPEAGGAAESLERLVLRASDAAAAAKAAGGNRLVRG
jgi:diguanylate cyclase (GGDEF)-like protein